MPDGPVVGILVGSESDRERMEGATKTLDEAASPTSSRCARRTARPTPSRSTRRPRASAACASSSAARALAAALPGAVAAHTDLPVIGVPLRSSLSVLDGLDALLAIAQMPPGVPVAAVGVDNAANAAALALRILNA
jgi:phosphoribosylaminoimidazole carboxylase PurE protein